MENFPNNSQSNFTTILEEPIELDGPHELALVDMSYSANISINLGTVSIEKYFDYLELYEGGQTSFSIKSFNGQTAQQFIDFLNDNTRRVLAQAELEHRKEMTTKPLSARQIRKLKNLTDMKLSHLPESLEVEKGWTYFDAYTIINTDIFFILCPTDLRFLDITTKFEESGAAFNKELHKWQFNKEALENIKQLFDINIITYDPVTKLSSKTEVDNYIKEANKLELTRHSETIKRNYADIPESTSKLNISDNGVSMDIIEDAFYDKSLKYFGERQTKAKDGHVLQKINYQFNIKFEISNKRLKISGLRDPCFLTCQGRLARILGLAQPTMGLQFFDHATDYYFPDTIDMLQYGVVYTDVIEYQYLGNKKTPVLKIIPISLKNDNSIISYSDLPQYVRVSKNIIDTINISIVDLEGLPIQFENLFATVIVKLHLRKCQL